MTRLVSAMILAMSILGWSALMAQSKPPKLIAELPGASLKWVHAAEPEFQRNKLDLDKYTVSIVEESDSVTLILKSSDAAEGARGSTGRYPGYEVEISKKDLKVLRSNYIR